MSLKAMLFCVLVLLATAPVASARQADNIPNPPLTVSANSHGDTGKKAMRLTLFARSATDMPVPGVKVFVRVRINPRVHFRLVLARPLGPYETLKVSKDGKLLTWSMYSAPPNTGSSARLPFKFFVPRQKETDNFSVQVWGTTIEGTQPTPPLGLVWGTA
jgi:hypothetical protein